MKRRDLIKTGLAALGASAIALTGCSENDTSSFDIIPKQTATYEFSAPLPFDFKKIDEMAELNSIFKKSQIKRLYSCIPKPLVNIYDECMNAARGENNYSIKTLDDFGQYVKYALDKGFDFTYLMNSSKPFTEKEFLTFKDDFLNLLEYLKKIGVKNIKVATNYTAFLINKYAPNEFNLQVSTCYGLNKISQYKSLFKKYSNFNYINVPKIQNQNFILFNNFKKLYPDKKIEVIVNEECVKNCSIKSQYNKCKYECLQTLYSGRNCLYNFVKSTTIFPWDMEYYSACGINNFKFTVAVPYRSDFHDLKPLKKLLSIIENGYENYTWKDLFDATWIRSYVVNEKNKYVKLADIAPLFPSMKHFIRFGDKCDERCEAQCNYCFDCAKKLEEYLKLG